MEESTIIQSESPEHAHSSRFRLATFSSLRHADFFHLWIGTFFMSAGQWIQQVTLGWLVYDLTNSSVSLGILNGLRALPFLITGPVAGVAADRMDRRNLMLITQYVLMTTALGMGTLVALGHVQVWHVFLFTILTGSTWSFIDPVRQSVVPNVVPKKDLVNAVALNSMAFNSTKVLGPSLGGLLIALTGAAGNFFVQGAVYVGVLISIYKMRVPPTPPEARRSSVMANLKEGLAYVWSNPTVLALMLAALVPRVFAVPYQTLMPVFQKDVLHVGPEGLGLMLAAPGIGAVLAVFIMATLAHRMKHQGVLLILSLVMLGVVLNLFSWTRSFPLALLALVGVGACQVLFMATTNTMLQIIIPDALRGRVMSIYMLDRGLMPLGALLAGVTAHFVGAPATVSMMGSVVILLALLVAWRVPLIRNIEA